MKTITFFFGVTGALLFILASIFGGLQIEAYSVISQYISESYASGIPNTEYLRYMFIASGFLLAMFGFMAPMVLPKANGLKIGFFLFAIFYGLGTVSTGYFPCDFGCPSDSEVSLSQFIHNASGFLTYSIVPFCLIGIGLVLKKDTGVSKLSKVSLVCGVLAIVFVVLLFSNPTGFYIGLFQRIIEGSILFWVVVVSFYLLKTTNKSI